MDETDNTGKKVGSTSNTDLDWINYGQNLIRGSTETLENAAKTLVTLNTSLITIYSVALSYFGNANKIFISPYFFLLIIPFASFFFSIYFFIEVYSPTKHTFEPDKPDEIKKVVKKINDEKLKSFKRGKVFFLVGFILIIFSLFFVSSWQLPQNMVKFVVKNENVKIFNDMNIEFENNMTTVPLILVKDEGSNYQVKMINSSNPLVFNKDLVNGIIFLN